MSLKRLFAILLTVMAGLASAAVAATPAETAPQAAAPEQAHALSAEDLRVFFDGMVPYALHRGDIAGATISVVKDGKLLFAQGYGYADLKAKKPIYVGPLKDNKTGKVVIDKTYDNLDPFLDKMDYLIEGVVGSTT